MSYNQLTRKRTIELCDWMRGNEQAIKSEPDEAIAAQATESLGFTVSPRNIEGMRLDLGWRKRMKIDAGKTAQMLHNRIAALESAMDRLKPGWRQAQ